MLKKSCFLLLLFLSCTYTIKAQFLQPNEVDVPNSVWISQGDKGFWIDQTEIANIHWIEFAAYLKENQPEKYADILPDTSVWADFESDEYVANYYQYQGFRFFPVVGISYEQAQAYCGWRSEQVTKNFNALKQKKKYRDYDISFHFRLPTEEEWMFAAQANGQNAYGFKSLNKKQQRKIARNHPNGYRRANVRYSDKENLSEASLITEYIFAHFPNEFGIYNMVGNVAEMVQEKGISKGGSWKDLLEDCTIKSSQKYQSSQAWLGFRCVCEVEIRPKSSASLK